MLAEALSRLTILNMNRIGSEEARALATALRNNATITSPDLDENYIGTEGARLPSAPFTVADAT